MLQPNNYQLDQEYRTRQMNRADRVQLINSATEQQPKRRNPLFEANLISTFWIVASIAALIIFFFFGASNAQAQDETVVEPGEYSTGSNDLAYLYLRAAVVAIEDADYADATLYLDNALILAPDLAAVYIARSYIALQQDDSALALADALYAYDLNSNDLAVEFVLAEAYFADGQYLEAQAHYNSYLASVTAHGAQPILITSMLGTDSMPLVIANLNICNTHLS